MARRTRPKKKKGYHHGNLREALIAAAIELIHESGSMEFTLRQLAKRIGVSHAAAYHHFTDKNAILAAVAREGFHDLEAALDAAVEQAGDDPMECLATLSVTYVQFAREHTAHFRVMFGEQAASAAREAEAVEPDEEEEPEEAPIHFGASTTRKIAECVRQCQGQKLVREGSAEEMATLFWSFVHGAAHLHINGHLASGGDGQIEEAIGSMATTIFRGIQHGELEKAPAWPRVKAAAS